MKRYLTNCIIAKRKSLLFLFFLFVQHSILSAQHFEWAASSRGIHLDYRYACIDSQDNIVVGGSLNPSNTNELDRGVFDGNGKNIGLRLYNHTDIVLSYSPTGSINWFVQFNSQYNRLHGISRQGFHTVLLIMIEEIDTNENDFPIGYLEELVEGPPIKHGLNLFYLDTLGKCVKHKSLFENMHSDIEVTEFISHPNGGFVLSAFVEDGLVSPGYEEPGKGGADMLLKIDGNGRIEWMRLASNHNDVCCSFYESLPKVAIADNGDIYMGGGYKSGITFDDENTFSVSPFQERDRHTVSANSYVASYSAKGDLNWVKSSGQPANLKSIAANNKEVLVALQSGNPNQLFGQKVDSGGESINYVIKFKSTGNLKWIQNIKGSEIYDIHALSKKGFLMSGQPERIQSDGYNYYMKGLKKNKFKPLFESSLLFRNWNTSKLLVDSEDDVYIVGTVFYGLPFELKEIDTAFYKAKAYGSAPVIISVRL